MKCYLRTVKHSLQTVYPFYRSRSMRMDRQTVYNYSSHENIPSPTYEMRLTNRKTSFTDRIPLLSIRWIRTDRYGAGVLDNPLRGSQKLFLLSTMTSDFPLWIVNLLFLHQLCTSPSMRFSASHTTSTEGPM